MKCIRHQLLFPPRALPALLLGVLLAAVACRRAEKAPTVPVAPAEDLVVAHWNVENLFDTEDDPGNEGDDEFTPDSWRRWTEQRYRLKLQHLAEGLGIIRPDLMAVCEVENRRVLEDLAGVCRERYDLAYPHLVHREGPDHRGIDVAILSRFPAEQTRWITPVPGQRDVLVATFRPYGRAVTVIANHWKSRYGGRERTAPQRRRQAEAVRREIDRMQRRDPDACILLVGDFNDDFDDAPLREQVLALGDRAAVQEDTEGRRLWNLHGELRPVERGTYYYRRDRVWNSFDTISISRPLMPEAVEPGPWVVVEGSYRVWSGPPLANERGFPEPFRFRNDKARGPPGFLYGYSDHFPVSVRLRPRVVTQAP